MISSFVTNPRSGEDFSFHFFLENIPTLYRIWNVVKVNVGQVVNLFLTYYIIYGTIQAETKGGAHAPHYQSVGGR